MEELRKLQTTIDANNYLGPIQLQNLLENLSRSFNGQETHWKNIPQPVFLATQAAFQSIECLKKFALLIE